MIYTITYILNDHMDCIKCKGKWQLIKQYYNLIEQNAKIVKIQDMLGDKVDIVAASRNILEERKLCQKK